MRKKILATLLILLSITAIISITKTHTENATALNITTPSWVNWTVKRLYLAQDPVTGGWNGDVSFTILPSLYHTYHGIMTLTLLNLSPTDPEKTREFLREEEENFYSGRNYPSVLDAYYLLSLFKEFNMSPRNREAFENFILEDMKKSNETFLHAKTLILLNSTLAKKVSMFLWLELRPEHSLEFLWNFLQLRELLLESGYSPDEIPNYAAMNETARTVFNEASRRIENLGFFDLNTLARFIWEEHVKNETLRRKILTSIQKYKCPDGSYSGTRGAKKGYIDTTHWAVETITYAEGEVGADTVSYLRSLEGPLGGFINIPNYIVPNPVGTAFSVMTLKLLNSTVPNETTVRNYLLTEISRESKPSLIWAEYEALKELGVSNSDLKTRVEPRLKSFIANLNLSEVYQNHYLLKDIYYLLVTSRELGIEIDEQWKETVTSFVLDLKDDDGGFGSKISKIKIIRLEITLYSVLILNELGYGYRDKKTVKFIKSNRHGALWWSLPITRYTLLALNSMGAKVDGKEEIAKALELRKCPYGFFSYAPCEHHEQGGPIPTFLALDILRLLDYH
ncbi:prenyltransferase/squalene oxidase repeat-containing protein [Thermococcus aciditolerans]|uniref:Prenyltransferase alpha-alpha toroid domain-containing protein n=1 Tax=Thermococcus aciditolerans TaxID=2598455 RepID=A0A5C0SQ38_9EURY|nr:hypothetical protein [Thermococcus aciditolerans]QEK15298.1 hypothetical protein FPV09_09550 [Thermococcus aciditolerans]